MTGMQQVRDKVVERLQRNGHYKPGVTEADVNRWMAEGVRQASEVLHMKDGGHAKPIKLEQFATAARRMGFDAITGGEDAPGTLSGKRSLG